MTVIEITSLLDDDWNLKKTMPKKLAFSQHYILTLMLRPYMSKIDSKTINKYFNQYLNDYLNQIRNNINKCPELKMSMYYCISSKNKNAAISILKLLKLSLNRSIFRFSAMIKNRALFSYMISQRYPKFIKNDNDVYFILNDAVNVNIKEGTFIKLIYNIKRLHPQFMISFLTFLKVAKKGYTNVLSLLSKHIDRRIWPGMDVYNEIKNINSYPAKSIDYLNEFFQSSSPI